REEVARPIEDRPRWVGQVGCSEAPFTSRREFKDGIDLKIRHEHIPGSVDGHVRRSGYSAGENALRSIRSDLQDFPRMRYEQIPITIKSDTVSALDFAGENAPGC